MVQRIQDRGLSRIAPLYNARMLRGSLFDLSTAVLIVLALLFTVVAYLKDPGLPRVGALTGLSLIWFILPRLIPALILAGMLQVVIPQETVARYFGPLVAYMTSWSLFGMQRIIAWEAPLMGWRFVMIRAIPSLAFPVIAGWLVSLYYHE